MPKLHQIHAGIGFTALGLVTTFWASTVLSELFWSHESMLCS